MTSRIIGAIATELAQELELDPRDPEPQIVAHALMGLWELRESCMGRHIDDGLAGRALQEAVQGDVARAARVLETGLLALHVVGQGRQIAGAARAMNDARKEIAGAVRDARSAWRAMRAAQLERERAERDAHLEAQRAERASARPSGARARHPSARAVAAVPLREDDIRSGRERTRWHAGARHGSDERTWTRNGRRAGTRGRTGGGDRARRARAEAVAVELGDGATGFALDVRDPATVRDGVDAVVDGFGGIDLLVCNAGIGQRTVNPDFLTDPQPFWKAAPDAFGDVVATKIMGNFLVAREVVPRMLAAGGGRVVVISMNESTMTRRVRAIRPVRRAVEALARVMAADLEGSPVTLNILLPGGATESGMIPEGVPEELRARLLDPALMGPPIVWLASPAADGVHGERIVATEFDAGG